jgi:hypothetical protein
LEYFLNSKPLVVVQDEVAALRGTKSLERSAETVNNLSLELADLVEEGESAYGSESGRASIMSTLERWETSSYLQF